MRIDRAVQLSFFPTSLDGKSNYSIVESFSVLKELKSLSDIVIGRLWFSINLFPQLSAAWVPRQDNQDEKDNRHRPYFVLLSKYGAPSTILSVELGEIGQDKRLFFWLRHQRLKRPNLTVLTGYLATEGGLLTPDNEWKVFEFPTDLIVFPISVKSLTGYGYKAQKNLAMKFGFEVEISSDPYISSNEYDDWVGTTYDFHHKYYEISYSHS